MLTNDFLNEMAPKLAKFHSIKYRKPDTKFKTYFEKMETQLRPMIKRMIEPVQESMDRIDEFPYNQYPKLADLFALRQKLISLLTQIGFGEIVFCHNDTNQKNIIWNAQERTVGEYYSPDIQVLSDYHYSH